MITLNNYLNNKLSKDYIFHSLRKIRASYLLKYENELDLFLKALKERKIYRFAVIDDNDLYIPIKYEKELLMLLYLLKYHDVLTDTGLKKKYSEIIDLDILNINISIDVIHDYKSIIKIILEQSAKDDLYRDLFYDNYLDKLLKNEYESLYKSKFRGDNIGQCFLSYINAKIVTVSITKLNDITRNKILKRLELFDDNLFFYYLYKVNNYGSGLLISTNSILNSLFAVLGNAIYYKRTYKKIITIINALNECLYDNSMSKNKTEIGIKEQCKAIFNFATFKTNNIVFTNVK